MQTIGNLTLVSVAAAQYTRYQVPTLGDLLAWLRMRLNDTVGPPRQQGDYTDEELVFALNLAYSETVMRCKSHKGRFAGPLTAGTHTYVPAPIFEPKEVSLGDDLLEMVDLGDMGVILERWNKSPLGIPTRWMPISGSAMRVHPTPSADALAILDTITAAPTAGGTGYTVGDLLAVDSTGVHDARVRVTAVGDGGVATGVEVYERGYPYATGAGQGTSYTGTGTGCTVEITTLAQLIVHGYSLPDALVLPADAAEAIPAGYSIPTLLDRAESEARKMRDTHTANVPLAGALWERWGAWAEKVRESLAGGMR